MKALKILLSGIMIIFALLQWNDQDGLIWMIIYGYVGLMAALSLSPVRLRRYLLAGVIGLAVASLLYVPDFIRWLIAGMPAITGTMQAESPFIELIREFLGLIITLLVMVFLLYAERSAGGKQKD